MFLGDKVSIAKPTINELIALAIIVFSSGGMYYRLGNLEQTVGSWVEDTRDFREAQVVVQTTIKGHGEQILECKVERDKFDTLIHENKEQISIIHGWKSSINQRIKRLGG